MKRLSVREAFKRTLNSAPFYFFYIVVTIFALTKALESHAEPLSSNSMAGSISSKGSRGYQMRNARAGLTFLRSDLERAKSYFDIEGAGSERKRTLLALASLSLGVSLDRIAEEEGRYLEAPRTRSNFLFEKILLRYRLSMNESNEEVYARLRRAVSCGEKLSLDESEWFWPNPSGRESVLLVAHVVFPEEATGCALWKQEKKTLEVRKSELAKSADEYFKNFWSDEDMLAKYKDVIDQRLGEVLTQGYTRILRGGRKPERYLRPEGMSEYGIRKELINLWRRYEREAHYALLPSGLFPAVGVPQEFYDDSWGSIKLEISNLPPSLPEFLWRVRKELSGFYLSNSRQQIFEQRLLRPQLNLHNPRIQDEDLKKFVQQSPTFQSNVLLWRVDLETQSSDARQKSLERLRKTLDFLASQPKEMAALKEGSLLYAEGPKAEKAHWLLNPYLLSASSDLEKKVQLQVLAQLSSAPNGDQALMPIFTSNAEASSVLVYLPLNKQSVVASDALLKEADWNGARQDLQARLNEKALNDSYVEAVSRTFQVSQITFADPSLKGQFDEDSVLVDALNEVQDYVASMKEITGSSRSAWAQFLQHTGRSPLARVELETRVDKVISTKRKMPHISW